ncbi:MAG: penicillin acylase family protein [Ignavibacteria bacterium]|nr:penicillin acylase family protein [Ignavibacteria bacterium]
MTTRVKVFIGLAGVLVVVGIAGFYFLRYQIQKSFPITSGTISVAGLDEHVDVLRDEYGVPLIRARNEHDLFFALGFVHAQDRLWQMDVVRRAGEGRLSELFGDVTVPFDRMFRIIGIRMIAQDILESLSSESKKSLQSYSEGVNAFINMNKGKYPVEFDLLGYVPEPWLPLHSVVIMRLMAWELNLSWWTDLTLGAIVERVGLEKALDIFPSYPENVQPIIPRGEWRKFVDLGSEFVRTGQSVREFLGLGETLGGSNAWVVAPSKSASGNVILANDTHLHLQTPSKWYEVQLRAPGCNVTGMSIAGIPAVVVGSNEYIAWGLTNLMADDADFYIERIDSTDTTKYLYDGQWQSVIYRQEEIHIKGDSVVPVIIRSTHHGPIVTDIHTGLKTAQYPFVASMRWTGFEISDEFKAFYKINRARNWDEFIAGVRDFTTPGLNFVYGDVDGNIGYWCGVRLPIRGKQASTLPLPGWDKSVEWKGFVPFEKLPHLYDPPEGYIASANNKLVDDAYPYHISDLWEPPSRIVRIREVLGRSELFSVEDFERLQNDKFSHLAKDIVPYIINVVQDTTFDLPDRELVFAYLRNWNFEFAKEEIANTIFQQVFVRLLENIYKDEMGSALFHDFVILANIPIRTTTKLVEEGTSPWFDDAGTDAVESRDDIIRRSLVEAVASLREHFGGEMKTWQWGDLHTVTLKHPFGLRKPLDKIFNIGPFPYGGGPTSLVSGEYSYNNPFAVTVGASFRTIVDLSKPHSIRSVLPSGQSGQAFHRHYEDQTQLWLNGAYRTLRSDSAYIAREQWDHLRLVPVQ